MGPILMVQESRFPICPETSIISYHYSLRNDPEERSSQLLLDGSLKSRVHLDVVFFFIMMLAVISTETRTFVAEIFSSCHK